MTYDKEKMTIKVGSDANFNKDPFQHFEEVYRRIIAHKPFRGSTAHRRGIGHNALFHPALA